MKNIFMTQIPGITVQRNAQGRITHVVIDVEQQKELAQPVLAQLKIVEEEDEFDTAFAKAQTLEESEKSVVNEVKEKYAARNSSKQDNSLSLEESMQSTLHLIDRLFDAKGKN